MSEPTGGGFFALAVRRPVALFVLFLTLLVIGAIAYARIPVELIPGGMTQPQLSVYVVHPGSSAEENVAQVVRPLEEQIRTLQGVSEVLSWSDDDGVWMEVRFPGDHDMDLGKAELRDRIERARPALPDTVDRIHVWSRGNMSLPLAFHALLHPGDSERTDFLVETVVKRRLEAIDGVSSVDVDGMLDDSIRILLDEERVKGARLDLGRLIGRLRGDNFTQPLGEVVDGGRRLLLRTDMRFKDLDEVARYPIGGGLVLGDVARIEQAKSVRERLARINGSYAYFLVVYKESNANVVEVSRRLAAELRALERDPLLVGEFEFVDIFSQGDMIEGSIAQLRDTALWGGAFAALILFAFLRRFRATLCVVLAIPVSTLIAIAHAYFTGGTFNILTMTGITLGLGMLVDNAVVVIENIARLRQEGRDPRAAAVEGARGVGLAVALATLTTVVVFLPLIFMGENPTIRVMFGSIGIPLCVSLLASLLAALVFLPVVSARVLGPRPAALERLARALVPIARLPARALGRGLSILRRGLMGALAASHRLARLALAGLTPLRWPLALLLLALAAWRALSAARALAWSAPLGELGLFGGGDPVARAVGLHLPAALLGAALLVLGLPRWRARPAGAPAPRAEAGPAPDSLIELLVGANRRLLAWTLGHRLLASGLALLALFSVAIPRARMQVTAFGQDENRGRIDFRVDLEEGYTLADASRELGHYEELMAQHREELGFRNVATRFSRRGGRVSLYWEDPLDPREYQLTRRRLEELVPRRPGHRLRFYDEEAVDTKNKAIVTFELRGPDAGVLQRLGAEAIARLRSVPGLSGVDATRGAAPSQVHVTLDVEQASWMGVSAQMALQNIAWVLGGAPLPRYHEAGRELPFYIEYDAEVAPGLSTLRELEIFSAGAPVSLASFASLGFEPGPRSIFRRNGATAFTIQGRVDDPTRQRTVSEAGLLALGELDLPRGYSVGRDDLVGSRQEQEFDELFRSLLLSIVLVFLLMGILFESVLLPFSVLFTIPFAVLGALWTLYVTGTPMDSVGWIGIIILVGVVVNNGIVLIDRIHSLRVHGEGQRAPFERDSAVLEGSATRVRPIVMTALTTIGGLLPMALGEAPPEGIDYRALATCVAGGLFVSTFFTLWVVPLAYTALDDLGAAARRWCGWSLQFARGAQRLDAAPAPLRE